MISDLRYSGRMLAKSPLFTVIAVLTLSVGIGSATVVFSAINALFLKPLPYVQEAERLVVATETDVSAGNDSLGINFADFRDLKARLTTISGFWVFGDKTVIVGSPGQPERLLGTEISPEAFGQLGVQPIFGRNFLPNEDQPTSPRVALLSYSFWQRKYGSSPEVIGTTLTANGEATTIIGVMPKGWGFPERTEIWLPFVMGSEKANVRGYYHLKGQAKLKPGVTLQQLQAEADGVMASLQSEYKTTNAGVGIRFTSLQKHAITESAESIRLLFGAVLFVFLIACLNVANLQLSRGSARNKEVAIRLALGADRARLIRQFFAESVVLGLLGGVGGFIFALWGVDLMAATIPVEIPFWLRFDVDGRVFLFVALLSLVATAIFGLVPAFKATKTCLVNQLKEGGRTSEDPGAGHRRLRNTLVVTEVAIALVLLVSATLLLRSFIYLRNVHPGFSRENVLTFRTGIPVSMTGKEDEAIVPFFHDVQQRLAALPGVVSTGVSSNYYATGSNELAALAFEGQAEPATLSEAPLSTAEAVSSSYFNTLQIPLLAGHLFSDDQDPKAPPTVVVDAAFASKHFGSPAAALGHRFRRLSDRESKILPLMEIVGVVGNVQFKPDAKQVLPTYYRPYGQEKPNFMTVVMKTQGDPTVYAETVRDEVFAVNPGIPIYHTYTLDDILLRQVWMQRFFSYLFTASGVIALFLACIGIYGVMTFNVSQRQQELGMRMALGAQPREVIRMVLHRGMLLVMTGLGLGLVGAFLAVPLLSGTLYGVSPRDPPTFAFVPALLVAVALLACYLPSRRITRIDPNAALRYE